MCELHKPLPYLLHKKAFKKSYFIKPVFYNEHQMPFHTEAASGTEEGSGPH